MRRQRSVSDSVHCPGPDPRTGSGTIPKRGAGGGDRASPGKGRRPSVSSSSSSILTEKNGKESSKAALSKVLSDYKYHGTIVKLKMDEEYGFIKSEQVSTDIFFSLHYTTGRNKFLSGSDAIGKFVTFQVKDAGGKSVEARKVTVHSSDPGVQFLTGKLDRCLKTGVLIQVTSGLGSQLRNNRIFAPYSECSGIDTSARDVEVKFVTNLDKLLRVEARNVTQMVSKIELPVPSPIIPQERKPLPLEEDVIDIVKEESCPEVLSDSCEISEDLIKLIDSMGQEELALLFDTRLKSKLAEFAQQSVASKVIVAIIKKVSKTHCTKIEESITRMIVANFTTIASCKEGSSVVLSALDNFAKTRKVLIAEQLADFASEEELTDLWTHGGHTFVALLDYLDETSLCVLGSCLLGSYVSLACSICFYKPLRALLIHLVDSDCFGDILEEIKDDLITMSSDKYGYHVVIGILETVTDNVKEDLISVFLGSIFKLSMDPVCWQVIVTAIKQASTVQQGAIIEEVCRETYKQAEMEIITLAQDRHGHKVVLAMLSGTRHQRIHNILKASILCKQEEMLENEFAARVFKAIKMEFHNKVAGNYPKSHKLRDNH